MEQQMKTTNDGEMKNLNNNHKLYDPKNETPICHNNTLIILFKRVQY